MAELKPMKVETDSPKPAFRPVHLLAGFAWVNFASLAWASLLGLIPEQVTGGAVGATGITFFFLAIVASAVGYDRGSK